LAIKGLIKIFKPRFYAGDQICNTYIVQIDEPERNKQALFQIKNYYKLLESSGKIVYANKTRVQTIMFLYEESKIYVYIH
jgi:hypothetical protein